MDNVVNFILILIGSISTILLVLEASGLLPLKFSRLLHKNKLGTTIDVLNELGFDLKEKKKKLKECLTSDSSFRVQDKLAKITIYEKVEIGKTQNGYIFPNYIDLMGSTTFQRNATDFARELNTFKENLDEKLEFDFVVTSKLGSPILGYEFANLLGVPLVLHSDEEKFRLFNANNDPRAKFDFGCIYGNAKLKKALIVDDSTTGGRKVINIIKDLRKNGYEVTDCLVVFAPQGKNAYEKLDKENVKLHSLVQTPIMDVKES